jgi:hypothetical protein
MLSIYYYDEEGLLDYIDGYSLYIHKNLVYVDDKVICHLSRLNSVDRSSVEFCEANNSVCIENANYHLN